jgi:hypothetical protein
MTQKSGGAQGLLGHTPSVPGVLGLLRGSIFVGVDRWPPFHLFPVVQPFPRTPFPFPTTTATLNGPKHYGVMIKEVILRETS